MELYMEQNYRKLVKTLISTLEELENVNREKCQTPELTQEYRVCMNDTKDFVKKMLKQLCS